MLLIKNRKSSKTWLLDQFNQSPNNNTELISYPVFKTLRNIYITIHIRLTIQQLRTMFIIHLRLISISIGDQNFNGNKVYDN